MKPQWRTYLLYKKISDPTITGRMFDGWAHDITELSTTERASLIKHFECDPANSAFKVVEQWYPPRNMEVLIVTTYRGIVHCALGKLIHAMHMSGNQAMIKNMRNRFRRICDRYVIMPPKEHYNFHKNL